MKTVALITGASSGIGKEFAYIHAKKGGDLILVARNEEQLREIKLDLEKKYNSSVVIINKDLSKPNAPEEVYNEIKKAKLEVEFLINNAGFGGRGKFHEREWNQDLTMIQLNIIALTALTRYFLPDFVKRNSGRILNVSSTASLMPGPLQAVYYATKAYVTSFSNAIAEELHDTNITVTTLLPGVTDTGFAKTSGMDKTSMFNKAASPRKVAEDGYNGMLAGKLNVISGTPAVQRFLLSLLPITPRKLILRQIRHMQEIK